MIVKVAKGEFRKQLFVGDTEKPERMEEIINPHGLLEMVWMYLEKGIEVPYVGYMYTRGFKYKWVKYTGDMVNDLLYINPGIDDEGFFKLQGYIVDYVVNIVGVAIDRSEVISTVKRTVTELQLEGFENIKPITVKVSHVFFEKGSHVPPPQKRTIARQCSSFAINAKFENLISDLVFLALDTEHPKKSIDKDVINKVMMDMTGTSLDLTQYLFKTRMSQKAIEVLKIENPNRPIKTYAELKKYLKFLSMGDKVTYVEATEYCEISMSRVKKFKSIK